MAEAMNSDEFKTGEETEGKTKNDSKRETSTSATSEKTTPGSGGESPTKLGPSSTTTNAITKTNQLPLQYKWTLWYNAPSQSWKDRKVLPIGYFATVADFWRLFNNISPPSRVQAGSDYHLFKGAIKPEWEDKFNAAGGAWVFRFHSIHDLRDLDHAWYECILNMVGHNFECSDEICGLVISIRRPMRRGKLSLWVRDASNLAAVRSLGKQFKSFCPGARTVQFTSHESAKKKGSRPEIEL